MDKGYLDRVIGRVETREVVGVVHDRESLENLEENLMEHGFDRGDIDIMASDGEVDGTPSPIAVSRSPEASDYKRHEVITFDDNVGAHVLAYGTLIAFGSLAGAIPVLSSGGSTTVLVVAIAIGGTLGGLVARLVRNRIVGARARRGLERDLANGGMALLVRVYDEKEQTRALSLLKSSGADHVHVHNVDMTKTLHEIPFASMKPDPWLSPGRLGG